MTSRALEDIKTKWDELRRSLATIGFRRTLSVIRVRFVDAWFDRRHGLDTVTRVWSERVPGSDTVRVLGYQPTGMPAFRGLLRAVELPRSVGFVDYGSGKGRILLLAAEAGFKRVIGVEYSSRLCEIARANVSRYRSRRPSLPAIEIIEGDASRFDPPEDAGVFYFYHPFDDVELTREAVDRIAASVRRHPRECWVVYNIPLHREVVEAHPEFVLTHDLILGGYQCRVYRFVPPTTAG